MHTANHQPQSETELLTIEEVASRLNLSAGSIWKRIARGQLPVVRFGRRCSRVRLADLERFTSNTEKATARQ